MVWQYPLPGIKSKLIQGPISVFLVFSTLMYTDVLGKLENRILTF